MSSPTTLYGSWERYENAERWTSYYHQVDLVKKFAPTTCLEIGVGNGIVSQVIRQLGIELTTLDIDAKLQPSIVGSVTSIPLPDTSVDVVLCAEVLEHLPFDVFETCIAEIARVAKEGAVISLPRWGYTMRLLWSMPFWKGGWAYKLPFTKPITPGGEHCWEIGRTGYPLARIQAVLKKHFIVERTWLSVWMPYHQFFVLRKRRA